MAQVKNGSAAVSAFSLRWRPVTVEERGEVGAVDGFVVPVVVGLPDVTGVTVVATGSRSSR